MNELRKEIALSIRARYPLIYLLTWEEERAERFLADVCKSVDKELVTWSRTQGFKPKPKSGDNSQKAQEALQTIQKSSEKAVYVLKDFHAFLEDEVILRQLRDLVVSLKRSYKTVIILSPQLKVPPDLEKDLTVFDFPLPDGKELAEVLNTLLDPYRNSKDVKVDFSKDLQEKVIQATLGLTRSEAENVYAKALINNRNFNEDDLPQILEEKKQLIRKTGILDFVGLSTQLNSVGGLVSLKAWLGQRSRAFSQKARDYGLPEPKGILMVGIQGCGKSLSAKAIAAEWRLPLLRMDVGKIFDAFIGNSEGNMRKALAQAEAMSPACLWLDEIEKGFAGTQSSGGGDTGVTARVFGTFLTWMQEKTKPVFVIATANNIDQLPPELLRKGRFDEIFFVDLPTQKERAEIFRIHIKKKKRKLENYDVDQMAQAAVNFSGAEIEEAVVSAMYRAFDEDREFTTQDILDALAETVPLAITAKERISALREWADQRARPAS